MLYGLNIVGSTVNDGILLIPLLTALSAEEFDYRLADRKKHHVHLVDAVLLDGPLVDTVQIARLDASRISTSTQSSSVDWDERVRYLPRDLLLRLPIF